MHAVSGGISLLIAEVVITNIHYNQYINSSINDVGEKSTVTVQHITERHVELSIYSVQVFTIYSAYGYKVVIQYCTKL